ncbi:LysR family transcriptional regulator [Kaustia mangrovi]|uniref:LysR family transcriptional regulator n=1 Tax=Kaustia mangrovi TaxID=2593653 RepID=A0A7S8C3P8_9HYPH|nr:LysR substrate-binding domain-containing protein [Kaustia mangrovi]QPC42782.1 LysR family transcriptional regulator [Kaustia mangrovi]
MPYRPTISLDGVVAFTRTVELGSFSAASEDLGLSKSAAAKAVARLEERLGVQLLLRTTRTLTLTQEGEIFFEKCRAILEDIDTAEALMSERRREISGTLRVSVPVAFGRLWAAPTLTKAASKHPALALNLSFTDRYIDLVEEGIDLAVRIGSSSDSASVITRKLVDQHSILCAAPHYLYEHGAPKRLEDLNAHRCLLFEHGGYILPWQLKNQRGEIVDQTVNPHMIVSHGEALLDAAISGYGIAYLSTWLAGEHLKTGALVQVMPFSEFPDRAINLLWPRRRDQAPKIRFAIDALVERFSAAAPWT